jgi:hypothetical protein
MNRITQTLIALAGCIVASGAWAAGPADDEGATKVDVARITQPQFSPYAGRNYPTRVFFGDTHLHTAISVDAGTMNRVGQEDAYRFARGEEVTSTGGLRARLSRPLDFLVISDHAEMYGLMPQLLSGDPEILTTDAGKAPSFLVAALKDPYSGNLDRIQVVKGWLDKDGKTHEKVYDVAWSGDRKPGANGKLPPVGNTVDVAKATWKNTIGAPELSTAWTDPDFDAQQPAFYYARVIEIPTPRWTAYEALRFGIKMPPEVPMTTQERAYTSPIWYNP